MENTIKNMKLALEKVESELTSGGVNGAKTLMNTYKTLLYQFVGDSQMHNRDASEYKTVLEKQEEKLTELYKKTNQRISNAINDKAYKQADDLSIVSERLINCSMSIKKYMENHNGRLFPLHSKIERAKRLNLNIHVGIFSKNSDKLSEKFNEFVERFKDEILEIETPPNGSSGFKTKEMTVSIHGYSEHIKTSRMDEVYVDIDMSMEDLEFIKLYRKESRTPVRYF